MCSIRPPSDDNSITSYTAAIWIVMFYCSRTYMRPSFGDNCTSHRSDNFNLIIVHAACWCCEACSRFQRRWPTCRARTSCWASTTTSTTSCATRGVDSTTRRTRSVSCRPCVTCVYASFSNIFVAPALCISRGTLHRLLQDFTVHVDIKSWFLTINLTHFCCLKKPGVLIHG